MTVPVQQAQSVLRYGKADARSVSARMEIFARGIFNRYQKPFPFNSGRDSYPVAAIRGSAAMAHRILHKGLKRRKGLLE